MGMEASQGQGFSCRASEERGLPGCCSRSRRGSIGSIGSMELPQSYHTLFTLRFFAARFPGWFLPSFEKKIGYYMSPFQLYNKKLHHTHTSTPHAGPSATPHSHQHAPCWPICYTTLTPARPMLAHLKTCSKSTSILLPFTLGLDFVVGILF